MSQFNKQKSKEMLNYFVAAFVAWMSLKSVSKNVLTICAIHGHFPYQLQMNNKS